MGGGGGGGCDCDWGFGAREGEGSLRGGVGVEEDVAVFEVFGVGAHLEVFLEGVLALDRGDGG